MSAANQQYRVIIIILLIAIVSTGAYWIYLCYFDKNRRRQQSSKAKRSNTVNAVLSNATIINGNYNSQEQQPEAPPSPSNSSVSSMSLESEVEDSNVQEISTFVLSPPESVQKQTSLASNSGSRSNSNTREDYKPVRPSTSQGHNNMRGSFAFVDI